MKTSQHTFRQETTSRFSKKAFGKLTSPCINFYLTVSSYIAISTFSIQATQAQSSLVDVRPLPAAINDMNFNGGPTVSGDGLSLYFVSGRQGGFGGLDIWVSHRSSQESEWEEPQNLGSNVNTSIDDVNPAISYDGTELYFARATNFQFETETADIWTTKLNGGQWSESEKSDISTPNVGEGEPSISRDGLVLYFEQTSPLGVSIATRANTSEEFETSTLLLPNVHWPDISDDGLRLVTSDPDGISVRTRRSIEESFTSSLPVVYQSSYFDYDPVWMPDGETIYFTSDRPGILTGGPFGQWGIFEASVVSNSILGDVNQDGQLNAEDIDSLTNELRLNSENLFFDIDSDGLFSQADHRYLIEDLLNTYFGDSNLDGEFNSSDFVQVFEAAEYEDSIAGNSTWATGDWNGDADFNSSDFVLAFQSGGYEKGPRAETVAVPEPSSILMLATGLAMMFYRRSTNSPKPFSVTVVP